MDKRSRRQEIDIREQIGDQCSVIVTPGKQLDRPDDSWYLGYLDTIYSLALTEIDGLLPYFEIPDNIQIKLNRIKNADQISAFAKKETSTLYSISISEGVSKQAFLAASGFLSNNIFGKIIDKKIYPKDTKNIGVSFIMDIMRISFQFTLFHEFFHIALGHLDYLNNSNGMNIIFENQPNPTSSPLIQQAMEFQSDLVSTSILSQADRFNSFLLGMGITVFLDTFNYERKDIDQYQNLSHPHPLTRLLYSSSRMHTGENESISQQFKEGGSLALRAFGHYQDGLLFNPSTQSKFSMEQQFDIARNDSDEIGYMANKLWLEISPISPILSILSRWFWGWTFDKVSKSDLAAE